MTRKQQRSLLIVAAVGLLGAAAGCAQNPQRIRIATAARIGPILWSENWKRRNRDRQIDMAFAVH